MNNKPIGVFDSGLGGLSCVLAMERELPQESIIYFGDTARTPYGDKDPETIRYFTCQAADFLVSQGVKMLVIACNTISALCADMLRERYPTVPVVDIITPTVSYLSKRNTPDKHVGIIATKATTRSGIYEMLLRKNGVSNVHAKACPLFVPMIENGLLSGDPVEAMVKHYLDDLIYEDRIDSLVLGCTHYPFIRPSIRKLYPELEIVNPSKIVTQQVSKTLLDMDMAADPEHKANDVFYASDLSETFLNLIRYICPGYDYSVKFQAFKIYQNDNS